VSSGNSALAVALMARRVGVTATAHVPDNAPQAKLQKLRALGARIEMQPQEAWWRAIGRGTLVRDGQGVLIDAVRDPACLAGDATLGAEILEQCLMWKRSSRRLGVAGCRAGSPAPCVRQGLM
jgi:threonine dehydratase